MGLFRSVRKFVKNVAKAPVRTARAVGKGLKEVGDEIEDLSKNKLVRQAAMVAAAYYGGSALLGASSSAAASGSFLGINTSSLIAGAKSIGKQFATNMATNMALGMEQGGSGTGVESAQMGSIDMPSTAFTQLPPATRINLAIDPRVSGSLAKIADARVGTISATVASINSFNKVKPTLKLASSKLGEVDGIS